MLTDNTNRAVGEIRHLLSKHGGNLGTTNSVAWMFEKQSYIVVEKADLDEEALMTAAIDAGADDFREDDDSWEVVSAPEAHDQVLEAVSAAPASSPSPPRSRCCRRPWSRWRARPRSSCSSSWSLLEDQDDVQHVWSNFDIEAKEIEASLA